MEVDRKLQKLLELLRDPRIKGKQSAFDLCHQEIEDAKSFYSWKGLVEFIEKQSGIHINPIAASTMFRRAKRKQVHPGKTISPIASDANIEKSASSNSVPKTESSTNDNASRLLQKLRAREESEKKFVHDPTAKNISFNDKD